ncbi:MAG: ATP synthase subunit C [bacterium]|nr:ATP synthase subunit C [bacterium]
MMRFFSKISGRSLQVALPTLLIMAGYVWAQTPVVDPSNAGKAFYAAALSTGIAAIGAAIAVAYVGTAAVGALAEKPELTGRVLIFVGLAEGIAIYGLITAIMILGRIH